MASISEVKSIVNGLEKSPSKSAKGSPLPKNRKTAGGSGGGGFKKG